MVHCLWFMVNTCVGQELFLYDVRPLAREITKGK